jgi:hypothetical protein
MSTYDVASNICQALKPEMEETPVDIGGWGGAGGIGGRFQITKTTARDRKLREMTLGNGMGASPARRAEIGGVGGDMRTPTREAGAYTRLPFSSA